MNDFWFVFDEPKINKLHYTDTDSQFIEEKFCSILGKKILVGEGLGQKNVSGDGRIFHGLVIALKRYCCLFNIEYGFIDEKKINFPGLWRRKYIDKTQAMF